MRFYRTFVALVATLMLLASGLRIMLEASEDPRKSGRGFEFFHALAIDAGGQTLFLGAHFGLFRSDDEGKIWKSVPLTAEHAHLDVMAIAANPKDPRTLYVATHEAGVFQSTDHGRTWREANTGLRGLDVHGLAVDPTDPETLYAAVFGDGEGIYRTTNGGKRWSRVGGGPTGEVKGLASITGPTAAGGVHLYAATTDGLQRTELSGEWRAVRGLPAGLPVIVFAVEPRNPNVMFVVVQDELRKSTDAGRSWNSVGPVIKNLAALAVNPRRTAEMYAISNDGAIFKTTDGGRTWEQLK